jgi:hypothetical protein
LIELPDELLDEVYTLIKNKQEGVTDLMKHLDKVIKEDSGLLKKLAK